MKHNLILLALVSLSSSCALNEPVTATLSYGPVTVSYGKSPVPISAQVEVPADQIGAEPSLTAKAATALAKLLGR